MRLSPGRRCRRPKGGCGRCAAAGASCIAARLASDSRCVCNASSAALPINTASAGADQPRHPARGYVTGRILPPRRAAPAPQAPGAGPVYRREQCPIADDVDDARYPRVTCRSRAALRGEDIGGSHRPRACDGARRLRLLARQRIEVIAAGDALRQLAQILARQQLAQLRLANQDDLQQLLGFGLQVGEQPDVLEYLGGEVLASSTIRTTRRPCAWPQQIAVSADRPAPWCRGAVVRAHTQSSHSASRNSPGESRGLRISAISAFFGARASSERIVVVLPVPTSR